QQLVGQSPWPWTPVWERLAKRMTAELEPEPVWVIDDTGFPKHGRHSPGVERQSSGTLGKTGNCQVAVSLHQVGEQGNTILGWRLYLPQSWTEDAERRAQAGIPAAITFQEKWRLALHLLDQVRAWGLPPRVVLADAGYGEVREFRQGLEARALPYAVGIGPQLGVWAKPPRTRRLKRSRTGRPPTASHYGTQRPLAVRELAQKAKIWKTVRWREGSKGWVDPAADTA
ncbi:MAG: IS701 family transposase, partial [Terriglobia bacterium]